MSGTGITRVTLTVEHEDGATFTWTSDEVHDWRVAEYPELGADGSLATRLAVVNGVLGAPTSTTERTETACSRAGSACSSSA